MKSTLILRAQRDQISNSIHNKKGTEVPPKIKVFIPSRRYRLVFKGVAFSS
jgi:hypothetical protein